MMITTMTGRQQGAGGLNPRLQKRGQEGRRVRVEVKRARCPLLAPTAPCAPRRLGGRRWTAPATSRTAGRMIRHTWPGAQASRLR